VAASGPSAARVWDVAAGRPVGPVLPHGGLVCAAAFDAEGRRVALGSVEGTSRDVDKGGTFTGSTAGTARIWDAATGRPLTPPLRHDGGIRMVAFSPDGTRLATASEDRTARLWDAASGRPLSPPLAHAGPLWVARFSPDGRRLLTASNDGTARVWNVPSGAPAGEPLRHEAQVVEARFDLPGRRVVTACGDGTARVWDAASGRPLTPPLRHTQIVHDAGFSPDGQLVVSGSHDGTVRLWDALTGEAVSPSLRCGGAVEHVAFSADGRELWVTLATGAAQVWPVPREEWSLSELSSLVECLAGRRMDASLGVVPIPAQAASAAWERLRTAGAPEIAPAVGEALPLRWREAQAARENGARAAEVQHLDALVRGQPEAWALRAQRAEAHARLGEWKQAADDFHAARALGGVDRVIIYHEALTRLALGDLAGYADACRALLERAETLAGERSVLHLSLSGHHTWRDDTGERRTIFKAAWSCALGPLPAADAERALRLITLLYKQQPEYLDYPQTQAALLLRLGRAEEAASRLQDVIARRGEELVPEDACLLALIERRLHHPAPARAALLGAARRLEEWRSHRAATGDEVRWEVILECQVLEREAAGGITTAGSRGN
jgi:hypothetical protein